jgi:hypothetical protein
MAMPRNPTPATDPPDRSPASSRLPAPSGAGGAG